MNLPNALTTGRLAAACAVMAAMALPVPYGHTAAFAIFLLASVTDYFDGHLARTRYGVTAFGKLMDPLADKVLVCAALVGFAAIRLPTAPGTPLVPAWAVVTILAREFAVTGLRLLVATSGKPRILSAGWWGKVKTVCQLVAINATFFLLAIRLDILPRCGAAEEFLVRYDGAFLVLSRSMAVLLVALTVASGWKYFAENKDLVTKEM